MAILLFNLIVVILWAAAVHLIFRDKITFKEALLQAGIATLVSILVIAAVYYKDMGDTAVINGHVTDKKKQWTSCEHSYSCNCRETCSGSGTSRSCSTVCDTCYEHMNDWNWKVSTTVGNLYIDRIDRRGSYEPPRWTAVKIGEPAANTTHYVNYVKAAPSSLFSMKETEDDAQRYANMIPAYPQVYDYYRINRVMQVGTAYPKAAELNELLNMALRTMGAEKQVNINVVFVKTTDPQYRYAFERAWLGGKKNDVSVLIGMDNAGAFSWVDTVTFGKNAGNELLAVVMRDSIKSVVKNQQFTNPTVLADAIVGSVNREFHRKEMKDFEYLKNDYSPSQAAIMWFIIIQLLVLTGTTIFFYHYELERGTWASKKFGNIIPSYSIQRRTFNQLRK